MVAAFDDRMMMTRLFRLFAKASLTAVAVSYARTWWKRTQSSRVLPDPWISADSSVGERHEPRGWPTDWERSSEVENPGDPGPSILVRENPVDPREDDRLPTSRPATIGI